MKRWPLIVIRSAGSSISFWMMLMLSQAYGHDWKRPDLDSFYSGLHATGKGTLSSGASCCSTFDCHTTEAELRNGKWWARVGVRRQDGDWDLLDWREIPDEVIVRQPNGNPVANEAGEAVICHPGSWAMGMPQKPDLSQVPIFCFVPPFQA